MSDKPSMVTDWAARADRHTALRWVGIGLFCVATVALALNTGAALTGKAPFGRIFLSIFAMGVSLGSFGANNDTAIHALARLNDEGRVPERHAAEWKHEVAVRSDRLSSVHASPKVAMILPIVALVAVVLMLWRGLSAWGVM
jgi:hypothetical protein